MIADTNRSPYARAHMLSAPVEQEGGIVGKRRHSAKTSMIPHLLDIFSDPNSFFHALENFRIAAGESEGEFRGNVYGDGDFYKLLEGMVLFGQDISGYAALIERAQEKDGYISTKQIIASRKGRMVRHADQDDFEEYNFGHLFTLTAAACRMGQGETLLRVSKKAADYLYNRYLKALSDKKAMSAVCPSHYMGLAELYRLTGEEKYLSALKAALELRKYVVGGTDDNQDEIPLLEQREMRGHAVRATYLYAGVADLCLETGDKALEEVLLSCWDDMVDKKMYITGGLGALYTGASPFGDLINAKRVHQAFGYEYQLPNITAYNETCASLGGIMWASRMFQLFPESKYIDFIERAAYNLAFAAVSPDGNKYFYENMLRRTKEVGYFLMWPRERSDTFKCFCCPTNLSRFMAHLPQYAFFCGDDVLYTGLYMPCRAHISLKNGAEFDIEEVTDYPWDGRVSFNISNYNGVPFRLLARVPAFAGGGFRELDISAPELTFDMTPRLIRAHAKLEENESSVCVMRGPIVYCAEEEDLSGLYLPARAEFTEEKVNICGEEVVGLRTVGWRLSSTPGSLYEEVGDAALVPQEIRLIPYFEWDNAGFREMRIWIPVRYDAK